MTCYSWLKRKYALKCENIILSVRLKNKTYVVHTICLIRSSACSFLFIHWDLFRCLFSGTAFQDADFSFFHSLVFPPIYSLELKIHYRSEWRCPFASLPCSKETERVWETREDTVGIEKRQCISMKGLNRKWSCLRSLEITGPGLCP